MEKTRAPYGASMPIVGHVPDDLETPAPVSGCARVCPGG